MTTRTSNPRTTVKPGSPNPPASPSATAAPVRRPLTRWRLSAAVLPLVLAGAAAAQDAHYFDGGQRRGITLQPDLVAEFTPPSDPQRLRPPPSSEPSTPRMISRPTAEPMLLTADCAADSISPGLRPPRGPVLPIIMSFTMSIMPPPAGRPGRAAPAAWAWRRLPPAAGTRPALHGPRGAAAARPLIFS
jgi:hypothetical protein